MSHASVAPNALRGTLHCVTDRQGQRGFTLVETLVAIAIFVIVAAVVTAALQHALNWGRTVAARQAEHAQFEALVDRLHADEDTAWAIFTPGLDVLGQSNADGHEVDMFTRDGDNRPYFWAYRYDATAQTITKYLYAKPGAAALADSGSIVPGVASFSAATYTIDKLADASSPIYNPLYSGKSLTPVAIHYGYGPEVAGGNQITTVTMSGTTIAESLQLSTQTAPSGWTVRFHYSKGNVLAVSPALVVFPISGGTLSRSENDRQTDLAVILNSIMGGTSANAASCGVNQAKAYNANGQQIKPPDAQAAELGITDLTGCYDGHVLVTEPGYYSAFSVSFQSVGCSAFITPLGWSPSQDGPNANLNLASGAEAGQCSVRFSDSGATPRIASMVVQSVTPGQWCPSVGDMCTISGVPWPDTASSCDTSGGGFQNGYLGVGTYSAAPSNLGTLTVNSDGSATFIRTATGPVAISGIDEYATYSSTMQKNGQWTCSVRISRRVVQTWNLN